MEEGEPLEEASARHEGLPWSLEKTNQYMRSVGRARGSPFAGVVVAVSVSPVGS